MIKTIASTRFSFILLLSLMIPLPSAAETNGEAIYYVGNKGCVMCHRNEFADWEKSKHARAFELLKPNKRRKAKAHADLDPKKDYSLEYNSKQKCLKCHTTGFGKDGGFKDIESTPNMVGVGCESCHGPGSVYRTIHKAKRARFTREEVVAAGQTYGSVDPQVCEKCHRNKDAPMNPKLDKKYIFEHGKSLKNTREIHQYYEQIGKH